MSQPSDNERILEAGKDILLQEAASVTRVANMLNHRFCDAVESLAACKGKVIISGMGKSGIIGQKIAATLSSTGTTALFMHPAEAAHGDLGVVCENDVVIGLSKSGMTEELNFILPPLKKIGVTIISLTGNTRSYLAEHSDIVLDVSVEQEACPFDLAPTASTTAMLAMGDALAICLMREKRFTHHDFAMTHPKGSLGRRLTMKVADIMAPSDSVPLVGEDAPLTELVIEMTSKRFGGSGIVDERGKLKGIFTDGDLRRLVQQSSGFPGMKAREVMRENPKTVSPDTLAKECLELLETYRITLLFVCDDENRPVGIVHIHDIVTLGL
ncbi:D-arabinose 5-phosphate isomerase [Prosthecochloris sp. GSB1]|uniref:KpsF/GutQ family sugar-phosphate isomerase n=1 Tax=Prosthecochloris sp. GSB1 TaxID=281093 RepID=UPI000B8C9D8F|nr:KpsF/GutQ family sugar-phosphate isomerase [Prosthecochloris sp. GSB1]ASQ89895.1 D-arabinose 5-phosphate isomerase [Prosthecochloris sp. GSB1]